MKRRRFLLISLAGTLSACSTGGTVGGSSSSSIRRQRNPDYDAWVSAFKRRAVAQGIAPATVERAFRDAAFLPDVVERDRNQTEFRRSFEDYLALTANEARVARGRAAFARNRATLGAIERRYGVPASTVAAIWGVESNFGERRGSFPVISATSTLAYDGRRGRFFEGQLIAALKILQSGDITPERMTGSWAGAMGHTQFIPTSYLAYAVDFTGDGRRDIWSDDPSDALASAAAYLSRSGWQRGALAAQESASGGLQPDTGGPRFVTGPNFRVIKRYNNSDNYALAVSYLANRLAGGGPLRQSFGPDRYGLTQADREALQAGLNRAGFDVGDVDGVLGKKTFAAIEAFQRSRGLPVTGQPSRDLLAQLT